MHNQPETLGCIIKAARENTGITIEALANKVDITERYLYRIENEGKKPSFDVLHTYHRKSLAAASTHGVSACGCVRSRAEAQSRFQACPDPSSLLA